MRVRKYVCRKTNNNYNVPDRNSATRGKKIDLRLALRSVRGLRFAVDGRDHPCLDQSGGNADRIVPAHGRVDLALLHDHKPPKL